MQAAETGTMDVYEAVRSRRAVRAFTDRPVPREVLERVLSAAALAPSGSNIQPWHVYVLTGAPLAELKKRAGERVAAGDPWDEREYGGCQVKCVTFSHLYPLPEQNHKLIEGGFPLGNGLGPLFSDVLQPHV